MKLHHPSNRGERLRIKEKKAKKLVHKHSPIHHKVEELEIKELSNELREAVVEKTIP